MNPNTACAEALAPHPDLDYSLTGANARRAIERGLAEARWYQSPVPREQLRQLLTRRDGPALRDTALWFALLGLSGWASLALWGSWWALPPYMVYAVLYATASDSRWHETSHGTPFRTDWMNGVLYEIASFMVMRESVIWRWSHNRHHSDTLIVGRDPEIQVPRPPDMRAHFLSLFNIGTYRSYFPSLLRHARGQITDAERSFVPASEFPKVARNARIVLALHAATLLAALLLQSWGPVFLIILPHLFGNWLMIVHNTTQHAGLAENVLDHRLNCRTVYMNPVSRFIYWNMNYHVEHHQFPLVPYHALPRLHALIKDDCPPPYRSIAQAWRELLPTVLRQVREPGYHVRRPLPTPRPAARSEEPAERSPRAADAQGWVEVGAASGLDRCDVMRFDHGRKTYALVRSETGALHALDGICSHGNNHLADGLVKGCTIECPKHNGRFNLADGSPARAPVCRGLAVYPLQERAGRLYLNVLQAGGAGARVPAGCALRVRSCRHVATFIKELVLDPEDTAQALAFTPGDYLQLEIPAYGEIALRDLRIPEPYAQIWREQGLFERVARNQDARRNNYSLASNPAQERSLRLNVRLATPPAGQDVPVGVGSSYVFALRPGDRVTAIGPYGDFHIKPTGREMVYVGGGAGMAPLRAHLSHLLETENTARKLSLWYGARARQDVFYDDLFTRLAQTHGNFSFHLALSEPRAQDAWSGFTGPVHAMVLERYLRTHPDARACEYYLCGPPAMVQACTDMLAALGVPEQQIAYDAF
ncbi:fatty acid desaturase [Verminephrobacter aporrectodeae]|uniref:fatty acid desaturase n=1 Tax=Verminephrobacter aporrectodeae TaxID=1110389 RepID=UPI002242DA4A|nr:fatty acid desaturase [Verminephrobacter aporrectodeae]MCW8175744.1 NADH:ubiquinone reductase (Na(+)-transporting) subunit F [Verminephrobacter aporrectodeae subsp. tuberculatae]MCW8203306.1 NADH:ubiquinone reductase (Na(+)-transporting) subunit F [Verminephrobacter aporrectodeae subsp. tuberculatae]